MYQGENAKYELLIKDHFGNVIPKSDVLSIDILVYKETNKSIALKYSYPTQDTGYKAITADAVLDLFHFTVDGADTENLSLGRYILSVTTKTNSVDFPIEGLINTESAPIFTIKARLS